MRTIIFKDKKIIFSLIWRSLKWHYYYLFTKNPLPLACSLYITNKCNFKCSFCNIWRKPNIATLPLSKAKNIIDSLSELGCFYFSITGGEPLLVDYLFELLVYARRSRIKYIHLVTNGYLLDTDMAKRFKATGINEISISIDGNEYFHDKNRGVAGAYNKTIGAIENLKRYAPNIKIVLNAIFVPQAPFECLHVIELAHKFNVYLKVQPLNQHPKFSEHNYSCVFSENIFSGEVKEAIARLRGDACVINSDTFLNNIYNFFFQKEKLVFRDSPCIFGYHHIEVLEDGSVFPCLEGLSWKNGISVDGGLDRILNSQEYKRILERLKKCRHCQDSYYICYYEPRITFPVSNFLRSTLHR